MSSGYSEAEALTMFRGQRVSGFVQKPFTASALVEKVKRASRVEALPAPIPHL